MERLARSDALDLGSGLRVIEARYRPNLVLHPHEHDCCYLIVVSRGSFRERYRRGEREAPAGTVLGYRDGESHAGRFGAYGCSILHVEVDPGSAGESAARWLGHGGPERARDDPNAALLMHRLLGVTKDPASERLDVEACLLEFLGSEARRPTTRPAWLNALEARLLEDSLDRSLTGIAVELGVDPSHMARTFRAAHGRTPGRWRRQRRIQRACEQLLRTRRSLADVAVRTGFHDQAHLTRVFRSELGTSPGRWRRLVRG